VTAEARIEVAYEGDAPVPNVDPLQGEPSPSPADATADGGGPAVEPIIPVDVMRGIVSAGFDALADRRGDHWRVDQDEAQRIAEPLAEELDELARYAPFLGDVVAGVGSRRMRLLAAVAFTVTPRLIIDVTISREAAVEETRGKVTPIRPAANDTPTRSDEDPDDIGARLDRLPPRDGGNG